LLKKIGHQSITSASSVFLLVLFVVAGRLLGDVDFGKFSLALAVAFIIEAILDPGFYQITVRDVAIENQLVVKYISNIFGFKIIVIPIIFLLLCLAFYFSSIPKKTELAILLMVFAAFLKSAKNTYSAGFQAFEYFHYDAIIWTLERLFLFLIGIVVLLQGGGVIGFCLVFVMIRLLDFIFVTALFRYKICKVSIKWDWKFLKDLLIMSIPVGLFICVLNLYTYIDTIMISIIRGDAEVGWYNAAFKLYEGLSIFPMVICVVFRPQIAKIFLGEKKDFENLFFRGVKYVLIIALSVSVTGFIISDLAIIKLFGIQYIHSIAALKILLFGLSFVFTLTYLQMMLISMKKQKTVLYISLIGLLVNVTLNLILIPKFGFLGAAASTVMGEFIVLLMIFVYLFKINIEIPIFQIFVKPILSMSLPVILWEISTLNINVYINILLINVLFIFFLWQFRAFRIDDLQFLYAYREVRE
jgi:O-antigen/teichoic acid export membrane protein